MDLVGTHEFVKTSAVNRKEAVVTGTEKLSRIIMQNVEILAVDNDISQFAPELQHPDINATDNDISPKSQNTISENGNKITQVHSVTMLTTPKDAEQLIILAETSVVRLILRKKNDREHLDLTDRKGSNSRDVFKKEEFIDVEIIRGTTKAHKRFDRSGNKDMTLPSNQPSEDREI